MAEEDGPVRRSACSKDAEGFTATVFVLVARGGSIAQRIERSPSKRWVPGSSPGGAATISGYVRPVAIAIVRVGRCEVRAGRWPCASWPRYTGTGSPRFPRCQRWQGSTAADRHHRDHIEHSRQRTSTAVASRRLPLRPPPRQAGIDRPAPRSATERRGLARAGRRGSSCEAPRSPLAQARQECRRRQSRVSVPALGTNSSDWLRSCALALFQPVIVSPIRNYLTTIRLSLI